MILLASLVLFAGAAIFFTLALKKQRRMKAMAEIRNHIARDLHDDIGATLTSISFLAQAIENKMALKKHEEVEKLLQQIGLNAREAIASMNDTVWVINPKNDSVKALFVRIEDYARKVLAENNTAFYFYYKDDELLKMLNIEQRKHIYLICKEALNNCAKYAQAKNLELLIERDTLIIRDDGIGFDSNRENDGNGLLNMKSRAHQLGAKYECISEPNKGTSIKLTFLNLL